MLHRHIHKDFRMDVKALWWQRVGQLIHRRVTPARPDPYKAILLHTRKCLDLNALAERCGGHLGAAALVVIGPAVVGAHNLAILDLQTEEDIAVQSHAQRTAPAAWLSAPQAQPLYIGSHALADHIAASSLDAIEASVQTTGKCDSALIVRFLANPPCQC